MFEKRHGRIRSAHRLRSNGVVTGLVSPTSAASDAGQVTRGPVLCLVTELGFVRWRDLLAALLSFRRMRKTARDVDELLEASVLIRRPRRLLFISLWSDEDGVSKFATAVPEHPARVAWCRRTGAAVWSGLFDLVGASPTSGTWQGPSGDAQHASSNERRRS